jgi:diguanylate cyclase (GGDEF)-like protein
MTKKQYNIFQRAKETVDHTTERLNQKLNHISIAYEQLKHQYAILKDHTENLGERATHDPLTGLPNRNLLQDRLKQAIAQSQRYHKTFAVIFIDLDRFKTINDTLGHAVGDQLLKTIAKRLKSTLRDVDTLARLGGDEFLMILNDQTSLENTPRFLKRMLKIIAEPCSINNTLIHITCSIGFSLYPQDSQNPEILIQQADAAMYRAKERGRNKFQFFTDKIQKHIQDRLRMETHLKHALEHQNFLLHYQPRFQVETQMIVSAEALIRWEHPKRGLLLPKQFLSIAEDSGLMIPIGEWVLRTACQQNKQWQMQGFPPINVAVNISDKQFKKNNFVDMVATILTETQLEPQYLELDLKETRTLSHSKDFTNKLQRLKDLGVHLTLDDFGTGFSCLQSLRSLPIDALKIDASFIHELHTVIPAHPSPLAFTLIQLAAQLNFTPIAEGVETETQMKQLKTAHCFEMQGYYFSPPLPVDAFEKLFHKYAKHAHSSVFG